MTAADDAAGTRHPKDRDYTSEWARSARRRFTRGKMVVGIFPQQAPRRTVDPRSVDRFGCVRRYLSLNRCESAFYGPHDTPVGLCMG